ncbi:MAG: Formate hydrogenlyase subunit 3/Multisubunit Na+/H+ antiporter, MnhD subunit [Rhodobacteraceae bacterium HLUCCA24]|nr:MAG: Formate hydrogenlyase subunit 3/Multisubunit Na+/H+ antiporter, MnhD subunit [Rhodobacteraceae bacterium HLUCCA24]
MTAAVWFVAGLAAQPMTGRPNMAIFSGFWCLVLAGNLGVLLALDVVTFYVSFAAVSLASWFLIVHDRTETALRAGRVYIAIAIAGEVALLVGLIIGADAAQSMAIEDIRAALGTSGPDAVALALLVLGFGIKAGLVPLHVWLPLAHPAAPVPGSAVLSGAIVKAGLFGMILFVPEGAIGPILMALGLVGAFGAALWGLTQANPKAVLAYSTISQMGLMILLVGAGGAARETVPYFAMHHGLAKGALFLLVGVTMAAQGRGRRLLCLGLAAALCASIAGFPLTGGALAKTAVKQGLADWAALALGFSSVTTSLIMLWFLSRLRQAERRDPTEPWAVRFSLPAALLLAAVAVPWLLWSDWSGHGPDYVLKPDALMDALWPVALAVPLAAAVLRWPLPQIPPGDLLLLLRPWQPRRLRTPKLPRFRADQDKARRTLERNAARLEKALLRWQLTGVVIPFLVLLIFALLA